LKGYEWSNKLVEFLNGEVLVLLCRLVFVSSLRELLIYVSKFSHIYFVFLILNSYYVFTLTGEWLDTLLFLDMLIVESIEFLSSGIRCS